LSYIEAQKTAASSAAAVLAKMRHASRASGTRNASRPSAGRQGSRPISRAIDDDGVRAVFDWMDTNKDGQISIEEFRVGLLGCGYTGEQVQNLFDKMDVDTSRGVDFEEFKSGYLHLPNSMQQRQAAQAWTFVAEKGTCSLHHKEAGTVIGMMCGARKHTHTHTHTVH
jgi:hypothetical protein